MKTLTQSTKVGSIKKRFNMCALGSGMDWSVNSRLCRHCGPQEVMTSLSLSFPH